MVEPGLYKHFKGGLVEVLFVVRHSETLEEMVVYKTLYENRTYGKGSLWVRPRKMFEESVLIDGVSVPRFVKQPK